MKTFLIHIYIYIYAYKTTIAKKTVNNHSGDLGGSHNPQVEPFHSSLNHRGLIRQLMIAPPF